VVPASAAGVHNAKRATIISSDETMFRTSAIQLVFEFPEQPFTLQGARQASQAIDRQVILLNIDRRTATRP
jgi:hypothetical protein